MTLTKDAKQRNINKNHQKKNEFAPFFSIGLRFGPGGDGGRGRGRKLLPFSFCSLLFCLGHS